jgi:stage II sporulation protein D
VEDYDSRYNQDMEFPLSPLRMENWIREDRVAWCRVYGLKGYQNYRWACVISAQAIQKKAGSIGRVRRLLVTHRSSAGWADHLLVEGEAGNKELKGDIIRSFLGGIRSNLIWVEPQFNLKGWPEEFIIYGGGWGHGVGMCQVGCYSLAKGGKTCEEIVRHYFPKGDIKKLTMN